MRTENNPTPSDSIFNINTISKYNLDLQEGFNLYEYNINPQDNKIKKVDNGENIQEILIRKEFKTELTINSINLNEEVMCADHIQNKNKNVNASRICLKCNVAICSDCTIKRHIKHIDEVKEFDEIFEKKTSELEKLSSNSQVQVDQLKEIQERIISKAEIQEQQLKEVFKSRKSILQTLKNSVLEIFNEEEKLCNHALSNIQEKIAENISYKIKQAKFSFQNLLISKAKFNKMEAEWEIISTADKIEKLLKDKDFINDIKKELDTDSTVIKVLGSHVENNQRKAEEELSKLRKQEYSGTVKKLGTLLEEVGENIKATGKIAMEGFDFQEYENNMGSISDSQFELNKIYNYDASSIEVEKGDITNVNMDIFKSVNSNFDLLVTIKPKTKDIFIVSNPKDKKIMEISFSSCKYIASSSGVEAPKCFPENCQFTNIGSGIIVTGGVINGKKTSVCFMVTAKKNKDNYEGEVISYPNMSQARERHNAIYLKGKESLLVCSGFVNQKAEIFNLKDETWEELPALNTIRINATLAYINNRYVYCFSGFSLSENMKDGKVVSSAEVLDLCNISEGWTVINIKIPILTNCVMGSITLSDSSIILCGGNNAKSTSIDEVVKLEFKGKEITKVESIESKIPKKSIFMHNSFLRNENLSFNFDTKHCLVYFDPKDFKFDYFMK